MEEHTLHRLERRVEVLVTLSVTILERLNTMSAQLDALNAQVAQTVAADQAIISALAAGGGSSSDTAALPGITAQLAASTAAVNAALSTFTGGGQPPVPGSATDSQIRAAVAAAMARGALK